MKDEVGSKDSKQTYDGTIVNAFFSATRDLKQRGTPTVSPVPEDSRIDGKTYLVTGANSGLGRAAAVDLARRGGNVILACRPGHVETVGEIKRLSGSERVEMMEVDLADMASVHRLCDRLVQREVRIDVALLNAGLVPRKGKRTRQGYEMMFAVHFLASRVMIDRWLRDGVIQPAGRSGEIPRIIFISSESHRSSHAIDFDQLGAYVNYGLNESLKYYGLSKLVQCTFATELSRRLNPDGNVEVAVHAMCPGGVATNIAREVPSPLKPLANAVLRRVFQSPEEAIAPVIYLCCGEEPGRATGMYLHMMEHKSVSPAAADPESGVRLWEASEALVAKWRESL